MKDLIILIPVKEKSSRLKNKNFLKIEGTSLLEKKITACKDAKIGKVVVSTNSIKIKNLSIKYKVDEVKQRSNKFSSPKSTFISVVLDYLRYEIKNKKPLRKYLAILPITNPFLTPDTIRKSFNSLKKNKNINSIASITEANIHPFMFVDFKKKIRFNKFNIKQDKFKNFNRSQDLPKAYTESAAIRITKTKFFLKYINNKNPNFSKKPLDRNNCLPIKIGFKESHDINTKFDFEVAKILNNF